MRLNVRYRRGARRSRSRPRRFKRRYKKGSFKKKVKSIVLSQCESKCFASTQAGSVKAGSATPAQAYLIRNTHADVSTGTNSKQRIGTEIIPRGFYQKWMLMSTTNNPVFFRSLCLESKHQLATLDIDTATDALFINPDQNLDVTLDSIIGTNKSMTFPVNKKAWIVHWDKKGILQRADNAGAAKPVFLGTRLNGKIRFDSTAEGGNEQSRRIHTILFFHHPGIGDANTILIQYTCDNRFYYKDP